jgi:hypothetical protein
LIFLDLLLLVVITADLFDFDSMAIHERPFSSASLRLRTKIKCFYYPLWLAAAYRKNFQTNQNTYKLNFPLCISNSQQQPYWGENEIMFRVFNVYSYVISELC